jgi:hypothetical protein
MGLAVTEPTDYRDDYKPSEVRSAPHYDATLVGRGRNVVLQSPLGVPAVRLYTDDRDVLGFLQVGEHPEAIHLVQGLSQALMGAKAAGAPASAVFDWWAARVTETIGAGAVETGDLELLSPTPATRP